MSITLYRGINQAYHKSNAYLFTGLESWTMNKNTAYHFARINGYVIEKDFPISHIFAGKRSTFKNQAHNLYRNNGFFVRRESEMIVENFEKEYDCRNMQHISLAIDNEII